MINLLKAFDKDVKQKEDYLLTLYLKELPLYNITNSSDINVLVNFHRSNYSCEVLDSYFGHGEKDTEKEEPKVSNKQKQTPVVSSAHKKRGQPSIVSKFPTIPEVVTEFLKTNGFKAQERRRDDDFRSCGVSIEEIRQHLLKTVPNLADYGISNNTIRYLFVPVNKERLSAKRY